MGRSKGKTWKKVKTINLENLGLLTIRKKHMNENIEKWVLEDGRRAEKVVLENTLGEEVERTTEIRVDEDRPKNVQQKIIEKIKPVVYERTTKIIDVSTGEPVEEKVESADLRLREKNDNSFVTRNEMIDAIVAALKSVGCNKNETKNYSNPGALKSLGLANQIEAESKSISKKDIILLGVIIAQIIGLIYLIAF